MRPEDIDDYDGVLPPDPETFDDLGLTEEEITIFGDDEEDALWEAVANIASDPLSWDWEADELDDV